MSSPESVAMSEEQRLRVENQRLKEDLQRLRTEKAAWKHPLTVFKSRNNIPSIHKLINARYRFLVAIGIVFVAAVIRFGFLHALGTHAIFVTFYPAVIFAALYGGLWPGLLAMVLSATLIDYYGIKPVGSFSIGEPTHWLSMGAFLFGCTLISCITEVMRREHSRAVSAAEQLAIHAEELERASDALAESEERLRLAIDAAHMGSWDWNMLTGEIYWTPYHEIIFGLEQGNPRRTYKDFQKNLHPDDVERVEAAVQESIKKRTDYSCEFRVVRPDGNIRWVSGFGRFYRDSSDRPVRMVGMIQDISEHKQAEEELKTILRTAMDGFYLVDLEGRILETNDSYCSMIGYSREELLAMSIKDVEAIESEELIKGRIKQILETGAGRFETKHKRKDGGIITVEASCNFLPHEKKRLFVFMRDITERKQAEEALRESEERLSAVTRNAGVGLCLLDPSGYVVQTNMEWLLASGFTQTDAVGRHIWELFPQSPPELRQSHDRVRAGEPIAVPAHRQILCGREVWYEGRLSPIAMLGGTGVLITAIDITKRKRAEEEQNTTIEFLRIVNQCGSIRELTEAVTHFFQECSGCEAVGIRLRQGEDYPYYETRGFSQEFVLAETRLCAHDCVGMVIRDSAGGPILECMCGNVLSGQFDPSKPFFTTQGAFWTNSTTDLLASTTAADRQCRTRNRCNREGYESVALLPLILGRHRLGLLQLNSSEKNRFTLEQITLWQRLANNLSIALARLQAEEELRKSHEQLEQKVAERTVRLQAANAELWEQEERFRSLSDNIHGITYQLVHSKDGELRFDFISAGIEKHYGFPVARAIADARSVLATIHPDDAPQFLQASEEAVRALRDFDMEARIVTPAGEIRWVQWRSTPRRLKNGDTVSDGIATDITERKEAEEALQRANRSLLMLKECDAALVRAKTEPELLNKICSILVNTGNNLMAWVGFAEDDEEKTVRPVTQMGGDKEYLKMAMVSWADTPRGRGPGGTAIRKQRVCQCRDTATDPRFSPWREDALQRGYASVIAIPLLRDNQCLGVIMIYSAQAGGFQKEEVELLERLAKDLAYGIIALRTRVAHEQLQRELLAISEREKQLISQELHDGLCQNLAGTAMMSRVLQQRLAAREDPDADCAKQICEMLSANVNETRNLSHGLHPVGPEGEGLMNALEQLAQTVTNLFHIRCTFKCPKPVILENETASTHLLRIAQESINNARKHGEAERIFIHLLEKDEGITLTIKDDGIGIPLELPKKSGMGLKSMYYRSAEVGASLTVRRAGKRGTEVRCVLPHSSRE